MGQIYTEEPRKIIKNKKIIQNSLNIKLKIKENIVEIQAEPEQESRAIQVIEAINLGFKLHDALLLKDDEFSFEKVNIKNVTKRKDIKRIRGRIIGTHGKALDTLESLTGCILSVHDSTVGIIGKPDDLSLASTSIKKLIQGSDHSKVYSSLERQIAEERKLI